MHLHFGAGDGKKKVGGEGKKKKSKFLTLMTTILYMETCEIMNQCILVCIFEEHVDLLQDWKQITLKPTRKKGELQQQHGC